MTTASNSELRKFKLCRRQWYLQYFLEYGLDPATEPPTGNRQLGTRLHAALQHQYDGSRDPVNELERIYLEEAQARPECGAELAAERDLAMTMLTGYLDWVAETGADVGLTLVAAEHELSVGMKLPDGNRVTLRGKLDQLLRRESDGALLVLDFKSVGTLAKANLLVLDEQMRFYVMLANLQAGADRVDGALYTMLKRSKRTARAAPPFYERVEIRFNRNDLNSMWLRVSGEIKDVIGTRVALIGGADHHAVAYPNPGDHCAWSCPYVNLCPLMDDGSRWQEALNYAFIPLDPYRHYEEKSTP